MWGKLAPVTHATRSKQRCATYHLADFERHFVLSQSVCRTSPTDRSGNHDVAVPAQCCSSDRFDVLFAKSFLWDDRVTLESSLFKYEMSLLFELCHDVKIFCSWALFRTFTFFIVRNKCVLTMM